MRRLTDAIVKNDLARVQRLIEEEQVSINANNGEGSPPLPASSELLDKFRVRLVIALLLGRDEIFQYLLHVGTNLNKRPGLNEPDVNLDIVDVGRIPALSRAVEHELTDVAKAHIRRGVMREWPLNTAVQLDNQQMVHTFVNAGANPEQIGENGLPILFDAARRGHCAVADALLSRGAHGTSESKQTCPAMSIAAIHGHRPMVDLLIVRGWNPDGERLLREIPPPLIGALKRGREEVVQVLLYAGANANICDAAGIPAIFHAATLGNVNILKQLWDHGAQLDVIVNGVNVFQRAVASGKLDAFVFFLGHCRNFPDLNQRDAQDRSLLRLAADSGDFVTFSYLENLGAVVRPNLDFISAMFLPWDRNDSFIRRMLAFHPNLDMIDCKGWTPLTWASYLGFKTTVENLIRYGANINVPAAEGLTPLQAACLRGHYLLVAFFIDRGAFTQACGHFGETALHCAVVSKSVETVQVLLEVGGVNEDAMLVPSGLTPLHLAAHLGLDSIVAKLLEHNADVTIRDASGRRPFAYAAQRGSKPIEEMLDRAYVVKSLAP